MPIVKSKYHRRPWYFLNGHFETIIPSLFFKVDGVNYQRERLELEDGDFLDLDWVRGDNKRLIVLSHGLEGSADRHYIKRPAWYFSQRGWDILAWNNRSCSGEMNRLPRFYHHGATEDIAAVIERGLQEAYDEVVLIGYSMGGGMQQKYLGERDPDLRIKGAVSFSVPCNVQESAELLKVGINRIYENKFIVKLRDKILTKSELIDLPVDIEVIRKVKNFKELDENFTLKVHPEYEDANDFYARITSDQFLPNIKVPLLIVNALNDPMLGEKCYPTKLADSSKNIFLEMPKIGGHVGFTLPKDQWSYMEYAADSFIKEVIPSSQTSTKPH
ncbi:MAG: alpha/beta hydrolase [Ekhidna sp.]|uniref:YheT family hydrolase n=1 Tax=Ekhidna sp. TaxID=2608089 RepID=UPI0032EFD2F7